VQKSHTQSVVKLELKSKKNQGCPAATTSNSTTGRGAEEDNRQGLAVSTGRPGLRVAEGSQARGAARGGEGAQI
jgi:hypothetical protein